MDSAASLRARAVRRADSPRHLAAATVGSHHLLNPGGWIPQATATEPLVWGCPLCTEGDCPMHSTGGGTR